MSKPSAPVTNQVQPQDYVVYMGDAEFDLNAFGIFAYRVNSISTSAVPVTGSPFSNLHGLTQILAPAHSPVLYTNVFDSYDPTTETLGIDRGLYSFHIGPGGELSRQTRLTNRFFPATLSSNGSFLYRSESSNEVSGQPIIISAYSIDQSSGNITPAPVSPMTVTGQESFDGQLVSGSFGLWAKSGVPNTALSEYLRYQLDPQTGAISASSVPIEVGTVDLASTMIAASEHFVVVVDGGNESRPIIEFWQIPDLRPGMIPNMVASFDQCPGTSCLPKPAVVIHPSERFAFSLASDSVMMLPLNPSTGPDLPNAISTPLPMNPLQLGGEMAISDDGKLLAVSRYQELDLFMVSSSGSLAPVAGSPFVTPFQLGSVLSIVPLASQ